MYLADEFINSLVQNVPEPNMTSWYWYSSFEQLIFLKKEENCKSSQSGNHHTIIW